MNKYSPCSLTYNLVFINKMSTKAGPIPLIDGGDRELTNRSTVIYNIPAK